MILEMFAKIEVVAYLLILISLVVVCFLMGREYSLSKKKLKDPSFFNFVQSVILVFSFIILKLSLEQVSVFSFYNAPIYAIMSSVFTILILGSVFYSLILLHKFRRRN